MSNHIMNTRSKKKQKTDASSQTDTTNANQNILVIHFPPNDDDNEDDDYDDDEEETTCDEDDSENEDKVDHDAYFKKLNKDEKTYFKSLNKKEKDRIASYEKYLSRINHNTIPLRFKILESKHTDQAKCIAINKLNAIDGFTPNGESMKTMNWINNMCRIPANKFKSLPVNKDSSQTEIKDFLEKTTTFFENNIYGHHEAKKQILRILAQWISNPLSKGNVIGIHGNPGVGKTTLVKDCICKALDIPFQFIPMGGASDGSYLEGHSFTYEGSTWGKIADSLMKAGWMNPVLYFDEIDKISHTARGQELVNILIHLTDPSQNDMFFDKYFSEFPIDLSKCLIIFTYNNDASLNPILKDRMIRIATCDYNIEDKINIAHQFILPEFYKQFNIQENDIQVSKEVIRYIVEKTPKEAGVRNLKRSFELIIGNINLTRMIKKENFDKYMVNIFKFNEETNSIFPLELTHKIVDEYLKSAEVNESYHHLYL